jgi:integrase
LPFSPRRTWRPRLFAHLHHLPGARLSYRRAAETLTTASGGWTLHQLRHSRLTHLAEAGVGLSMLMSKSRHTSLAIYAKPTFDAVAAATAALDPDRRR